MKKPLSVLLATCMLITALGRMRKKQFLCFNRNSGQII